MVLLQLESQRKVWMEQNSHFEEFYVWPRKLYFKNNPDFFADLIAEFGKEVIDELESSLGNDGAVEIEGEE